MTITAISNAPRASTDIRASAPAPAQRSAPKADGSGPLRKPPQTSATLSSAALAASKEAAETPAQTAQEARGNDPQAQRLLARETAARKAYA